MAIQTINPATGKVEKTFQPERVEQIDKKIAQAVEGFRAWRAISLEERIRFIRALASKFKEKKEEYGKIITTEMGRPYAHAVAEIEKSASICEFYADHAKEFLAPEHIDIGAKQSYVAYEPLGVILGVMPWNYPFTQVIRPAIPILVAGNAFILKHASNVPQSSIALQEVFTELGFPQGVFSSVLVEGAGVNHLIADDRIAAITVTGSEEAGKRIASKAGEHLKKTVLELGGSDAFIVLEDANIDKTVECAVQARTVNAGQSCNSPKRFIVCKNIAKEFTDKFVEKARALRVGDPLDTKTDIGPVARQDLQHQLDTQVKKSVEKGARVLLGGNIVPGEGFYYELTVLDGVTKGMPVFDEEVFGPVAVIIEVADREEAIRVANDTHLGLTASIWTKDTNNVSDFVEQLEVGLVYVNQAVRSDPRLPYGGVKKSGYGRELGKYGIREFTNVKAVVVKD